MNQTARKIVHIDMDCFYAAVEMRDRPDLRDKPIAVGGRPESRGIITTCNYKAREFSVHSALSTREALRRCPNLVVLPVRFSAYREASRKIRVIFENYTKIIEPLSLDEAYLDLTVNPKFEGRASQTAQSIRQEIFETLQLTASAGIAPNKFLAKVASDWHKPNGQLTIQPHEIDDFIKALPVKKIPGVGKATQSKMAQLNVNSCAELQRLSLNELNFNFGRFGERLYDLSRGIDHSPVRSNRQRKSISVENTFNKDLQQWTDVKKHLATLYEELEIRVKKADIREEQLKTMLIKFKFNDFTSLTREQSLKPFDLKSFMELGEKHFLQSTMPIRLLGIGYKLNIKNQKPRPQNQLQLFKEL